MTDLQVEVIRHLTLALAAGAAVGLERGYHGHAAGIRTHALVSVASAMLMLLTHFEGAWMEQAPGSTVVLDPTRMAQGIMTGIGFLGAGVIMKDGLNVKGLTTAASIWATAALGILIGVNYYFAAAVALGALMLTLTVLSWVEERLPLLHRVDVVVGSMRDAPLDEPRLRTLARAHRVEVADLTYRMYDDGRRFEHRLALKSRHAARVKSLCAELLRMSEVTALEVSSLSD